MLTIVMVEDSPTNVALYSMFLQQAGHEVKVVDTGKKALALLTEKEPDLVLLDLQLPDMNGLEVVEKLNEEGITPPIIVLTGNGSVRAAADAMRFGAMDFLMKPCSAEKLTEAIDSGLSRFRRSPSSDTPSQPDNGAMDTGIAEKQPDSRPGPAGFLGQSYAMQNVFTLIESAAGSSASVFITGESGTGKELCAQAMHKASPRHNGPFIAMNCAAIPPRLD